MDHVICMTAVAASGVDVPSRVTVIPFIRSMGSEHHLHCICMTGLSMAMRVYLLLLALDKLRIEVEAGISFFISHVVEAACGSHNVVAALDFVLAIACT